VTVFQKDNILLDAVSVSRHFGGIRALNSVSLSLKRGSVTSLIGPNGAGKTTFINVVAGIYAPNEGNIHFHHEDIAGLNAHVVASKGIARTFQLEELFNSLSVLENAMVGCHTTSGSGMFSCGFSFPSARNEERRIRDEAMMNLKLIGLDQRANDPISRLPLGERKLVGVARALSMRPKLLMLDEPAGGLAAHEVKKLVSLIHLLLEHGLTILIVEHNMPFVMSLSEKIVVLDEGSKIAEGTPEEIQANEEVIKAYLGEETCHE
jgi:ABC-type branched-subunit amino acid transport system ATPase component